MNFITELEDVKNLLPGDTPNKASGESCFQTFNDFLHNNEIELAFDSLIFIATSHIINNTVITNIFWQKAKELADELVLSNTNTTYSDIVLDCQKIVASHLKS